MEKEKLSYLLPPCHVLGNFLTQAIGDLSTNTKYYMFFDNSTMKMRLYGSNGYKEKDIPGNDMADAAAIRASSTVSHKRSLVYELDLVVCVPL